MADPTLDSLKFPGSVALSGSSTSIPIYFSTTDSAFYGGQPSNVDYISITLSSSVVYDVPPYSAGRESFPGSIVNSSNVQAYLPDEKYYYSPHVFFNETPDSTNPLASNPTKNNSFNLLIDSQTPSGTYTITGVTIQDHLGNTSSYGPADLDALGVNRSITINAVCFCRGTRIATTNGEVSVETLRIGDEVITARGNVRSIRWIGKTVGIAGPGSQPVIVRRGALPGGVPSRDLRVTRGHSFLFGDVLIPIGELVNGRSILWDETAQIVEVFHVELDVHEVIYADGAPAESYRDDGNRVDLGKPSRSQQTPRSMPTYAPVVVKGPLVERTRRYLERAAMALIGATTTETGQQAA